MINKPKFVKLRPRQVHLKLNFYQAKLRAFASGLPNDICRIDLALKAKNHSTLELVNVQNCKKKLQYCYSIIINLRWYCGSILKQNNNFLFSPINICHFHSPPLSVSCLSLRLSISDSLSPFSPHSLPLFRLKTPQPPHHGLTHCHWPWQATTHSLFLFSLLLQISVVEWRSTFRVWRRDRYLGVVWRSVLGCRFALGFVWVCCGLCGFGLTWVSLGGCRHGFHLRLSAWVLVVGLVVAW